MRRLIYYFVIFLACMPVMAEDVPLENPSKENTTQENAPLENATLEEADNSYMQERYEEAAACYEEALKQGVNADAFYNLGNCYYRMEDMGHAILNYERALLLDPEHEDALFNLEICKSKITDQFNTSSEMFFITWMKEWIYSKNADQWGTYGIIFFIAAFLFFSLYKFNGNISLRKIGFFIAIFCFLVAILVNVAGGMAYYAYAHDNRAVVVKNTSMYKSSNSKEEAIVELHPGTTVTLLDENSRGWCEIALPNEKKGWIQKAGIERIKE